MAQVRPAGWIKNQEQQLSEIVDELIELDTLDEVLMAVVDALVGTVGDGCVVDVSWKSHSGEPSSLQLAHVDEEKEQNLHTLVDDWRELVDTPLLSVMSEMEQPWLWNTSQGEFTEPMSSGNEDTGDLFIRLVDRLGIRSLLVVPMHGLNGYVGEMVLMTTEGSSPCHDEVDRQIVARFGSRLDLVLQSHRQRQQLRQQREDYEQLRAQLQMSRAVVQSLSEGAVALDRDGKIIFANRAAGELLERQSAEELVGENFHQLVHRGRSCLAQMDCSIALGLESGAEIISQDDDFARWQKDGLPVVYTMTDLAPGGERGMVVSFRDMSKNRAMQAQLLSTDRMIVAGTLAAGLAHEINNPLAYVRSNIRFVLQALKPQQKQQYDDDAHNDMPSDEMLREALLDGIEGVERIQSVVAGMQTFTRTVGDVSIVDVEKCLGDALTVCRGEITRHAEILRRGERLEYVRANSAQMTQVFVNLLLNAATAIEETQTSGTITIATRLDADNQVVEISDDGVGIDADVQRQIFDPFFTQRQGSDGTGLGLYVCRAILSEIGGEITVFSEPGQGATFRVLMPRKSEDGR